MALFLLQLQVKGVKSHESQWRRRRKFGEAVGRQP